MKKQALLPLLLAVFALPVASAPGDDELDELLPLTLAQLMDVKVTISTHTVQRLSKAPSVVSVITAEDLSLTGATNLMEILQSVPGIYVKQNLFGFKPLITFRGASGANVLLMVNGAAVKDLVWSPGIFWKGVPAEMIDRIEVIRGPGSALFGSDAAAGVINVITKTAANSVRSEAGVRAGSYATQAGWLHYASQANGYDISFAANLVATDGHDPFIARARGNTLGHASYGWKNEDVHLAVANGPWRFLADHTRHKDVAIGLTGAAVLDPARVRTTAIAAWPCCTTTSTTPATGESLPSCAIAIFPTVPAMASGRVSRWSR
jgi:iron complex outermembrane receptor protein